MTDEPSSVEPFAPGPPPFVPEPHTPAENRVIRQRQYSRAVVTALLLGGFVVLVFALAWVKIAQGR